MRVPGAFRRLWLLSALRSCVGGNFTALGGGHGLDSSNVTYIASRICRDKICNNPGLCDEPGSTGTCDEHTGMCEYPVRFGGSHLPLGARALRWFRGSAKSPYIWGHERRPSVQDKECNSPLECNVQEDGTCDETNGVCIYEVRACCCVSLASLPLVGG